MSITCISEDEWEDCGDGRLLATVIVESVQLHLEAIEVKYTGVRQRPVNRAFQGYLNAFAGGSPFEVAEIDGKKYALFASPFCT